MPTRTLNHEPEFTLDAASLTGEAEDPERPAGPAPAARGVAAAFVGAALVLGLLAGYLYWSRSGVPRLAPGALPSGASNVAPAAPPEAAIKHPVEEIPAVSAADGGATLSPLPKLEDSDTIARDAIETIVNGETFVSLLMPKAVIPHIVATIDNLPRKTVATQILPLQPALGAFVAGNRPEGMSIAQANAERYSRYVAAAEAIDAQRLAHFYVRFYPLFQQAYLDLGYPNGYFNDRLISVIDHLLEAPEPKAPVFLAQPKVLYEFAEPRFEELSAGQKILVRVGLDNERRLKSKLREIRGALVADTPKR